MRMISNTSTPIIAPVTIFCWYILPPSVKRPYENPTHLRIIFFSVPDALSMDPSACSRWLREFSSCSLWPRRVWRMPVPTSSVSSATR